jgi:CrcB protein
VGDDAGDATGWARHRVVAIGAGGAAGAALRWAALEAWPVAPGAWPVTVLTINVAGSVVLGWAAGERWRHHERGWWLRDGVGIGFCGGLTTFSTFAVEVAAFGRAGAWGTGVAYVLASVVLAGIGVEVGAWVAGSPQGLEQPIEEQR